MEAATFLLNGPLRLEIEVSTPLQELAGRDKGARRMPAFDLNWIGRTTGRAERRQIVVLAVGFEAAEADGSHVISENLARRHDFVSRTVSRYSGSVGRVEPDLQIAAWGWPVASEADARLAVAAAMEIAADTKVRASCGIAAGIAITPECDGEIVDLGFVGEMEARAVAQQARAPAGGVVVSDDLGTLIADAFELTRKALSVGEGIAWSVDRKIDRAVGGPFSQAGGLVGREVEIQRLSSFWHAATSGNASLVLIEGEAGVGRSALVATLGREVERARGTFIVVKCLPEIQHKRLEPIRLLARRLVEIADPAEYADKAWDEGRDICAAVASLVQARTTASPIAIVVEDLHWADSETMNAFLDLGPALSGRVLVVGTQRCDHGVSGLRSRGAWHTVDVGRLERPQIEQILARCEYGRRLGRDVQRRLAAYADGIPLYAHELARLYAETPEADARVRLLRRPNRLNSALTSRLDALSVLKPLAQAAAVLGRMFDSRILAAALEMDVKVLDVRLGMLVNAGILVRRRGQPAFQFRFQHALLWSQAYGSVPAARRRALHSKIAVVLSGGESFSISVPPDVVAYHWKKVGDAANACPWWVKAAQQAVEQGAAVSAVAFVNEALAAGKLAPGVLSGGDEVSLLILLGKQLRSLRGAAAAETVAAFETAMQVAAATPNKPTDIDIESGWGLAMIHLVRGEVRRGALASGLLVQEARERGRDDIALLALQLHGTARLMGGQVPEAITLLDDAVARYEPARHGRLYRQFACDPGALAMAHLSSAHAFAGNGDGARQSRQRALAMAERIGHPLTTMHVLGVLSRAAAILGEAGVAAALSRIGQKLAGDRGLACWEARARLVLAWADSMRDPVQGFERVTSELDRYRETGARGALMFLKYLATDTAIRAGRTQNALDLLQLATTRGEREGERIYVPELFRFEARIALQLDSSATTAAVAKLNDAEAMARAQGAIAFADRAAAMRAEVIAAPQRGRARRLDQRCNGLLDKALVGRQ